MEAVQVLVTCEHGGNRVPPRYRSLLAGAHEALASHRGYDAGALALARTLAGELGAPLIAATTTRLLVDLNRSPGHPRLHLEAVRRAPAELRREILARYYFPHRARVEAAIVGMLGRGGRVVHIAAHSFTPQLDGELRRADIGLLYDPARAAERRLCERWQRALGVALPDLTVRRNYPYRGAADGLCTTLRRRFPDERYAGIELEINQKHVRPGGESWRAMRQGIAASLAAVLGDPARVAG